MYAIVDIETTGSYANANGITEISIHVHDGSQVVDSFTTLINPQQKIPRFITSLTGIDDAMVATAPSFEEAAPTIDAYLKDCVFVAHNVNFDYSFLKYQMEQCGFSMPTKKLCTVRLARKIVPGLPSYSLGNLCRSLGIKIENRHRANGDAAATAQLFGFLLHKDANGAVLQQFLKKQGKEQNLPLHLPADQVSNLPYQPGVYYFRDVKEKIIYVGKAKNIKYRVVSHFSGNSGTKQRQEFIRNIHSIDHEVCGTELMALIFESIEIKRLWPKYNRSQKKFEHNFGLYDFLDQAGYLRLGIEKKRKYMPAHYTFSSLNEGRQLVKRLAEKFQLDPQLCFIDGQPNGEETAKKPTPKKHNQQMEKALDYLTTLLPTFAIVDKGRNPEEQSCILMEKGRFYGMGYFPSDMHLQHLEHLKMFLTPYHDNQFIRNTLLSYAEQNPRQVKQL
jgi:DNA polymerase III subunit epsilon